MWLPATTLDNTAVLLPFYAYGTTMTSKLTLSINQSIVARAKRYAREQGKSLSKVIEQYLTYLTQDEQTPVDVTQKVANLSDTLPASLVEGDWKHEYLAAKYLHD